MSSDFFKVKKGLNIQPTDPSGLGELQDGDIVIDSTDDNRMKVYDSAAGDFASVGSGGTSGNVLSDIEKMTPTVSNVVATTDTVTFLPIDDNNKSVKAVFSGSDGSIRYENAVSADLEGVQGVVKVWIKTAVENLELIATKDTVALNNGTQIIASNKWKQYEIPVVLGDADYGFEIKASGAVSGDVYIDESVITIEAVVQNLGAAHFVGKIDFGGSCLFDTTSNTYTYLTNTVDCAATNKFGAVEQLTNKAYAGVKIPNFRTDGYYKITYDGLLYNVGNTQYCEFTWSKTSNQENYPEVYLGVNAGGANLSEGQLNANVRFSNGDTGEMFILGHNGGSGICRAYGSAGDFSAISVHFYPDASSTVVTQDTELTAKTANTLTANLNGNGSIVNTNYDWIQSVTGSAGDYTITVKPDVNTLEMSCQTTSEWTGGVQTMDMIRTGLPNTYRAINSNMVGTITTPIGFNITCHKQGSDVNKSATIVGKFENINSSDLVKVKGRNSVSETVTNQVTNIYFVEVEDNSNAWDGRVFTAPKTSDYLITASVRSSGSNINLISLWISTDGGSVYNRHSYLSDEPSNNDRSSGAIQIKLNQGDKVALRSDSTFDTLNGDPIGHYIQISELPDTASIIKNLSTQKTKCQTKILSAATSSLGILPDFTFNNLEIGKRYEVSASLRYRRTTVSDTLKVLFAEFKNGSTVIKESQEVNQSTDWRTFVNPNFKFVATATTMTYELISAADTQVNSGDIELCELPDTYVETDEW